MYLLAVVTLFIAIIGTYTQVMAVEMARLAANQTSAAQAMLNWHAAAMSMAASIVDTNVAYTGATPCSLSFHMSAVTNNQPCVSPINSGTTLDQNGGTITNSASQPNDIYNLSASQTQCVHLPSTFCQSNCASVQPVCATTYDIKDYEFYSVLFKSNGVDYVVTYASAPSASSNLVLAGGTQIGITESELLMQLKTLGISAFSFGSVNGTSITSASSGGGLNLLYNNLLSFNTGTPNPIPAGSVALVGFPDGY